MFTFDPQSIDCRNDLENEWNLVDEVNRNGEEELVKTLKQNTLFSYTGEFSLIFK